VAFDGELYLRLAGERALTSDRRRGYAPWDSPLGEPARALVAVGALERELAERVLEDYELALALRSGSPHPLPRMRAAPPRPRSPRRVVVCDRRIGHSAGELHVLYASLSADATVVAVGLTWSRRSRGPRFANISATLADDRGTTTPAHFSGGGGSQEWRGQLRAAQPLAPDTAWIEVDGERIELVEEQRGVEVEVEPLPPEEPAWRLVWSSLASGNRRHWGEGQAEEAIDALLAAGAIAPDDPRLADARAVSAARSGGGASKLPDPWRSVYSPRRTQGRQGQAVVGAVTPPFDGIEVAIAAIDTRDEAGFAIDVEVTPDVMMGSRTSALDRRSLAWWARDDRGNHYLGHMGSWAGGDDSGHGTIGFDAQLDPAATVLELLPTAETERAVIRIPLELLR
jgi:hypothetical protein